ncbi:MAG: HAD-IIIA family hydrolase [Nitrospirae bacterium]|nr:HAD-IIIA family hydrolase [Nitrospirota bacterium]
MAGGIKLLVLDVDGVLTDGRIILDNEGNEFKAFHVRDGHGIRMLVKAGIRVAIITGRYSKVVERRARELGITEVYQKCHVKTVAFGEIIAKYGLTESEVAYVGDDIVDVPVMKRAGFAIAVHDATDEAKDHAAMVTEAGGGRGAVREVCDFLLKTAGLWESATREYFET